jgi:hypothetical protein
MPPWTAAGMTSLARGPAEFSPSVTMMIDLGAVGVLLEEIDGGEECPADAGAGGEIGFAEGIEGPLVIEGQRADEEGTAGEADDADAIVGPAPRRTGW